MCGAWLEGDARFSVTELPAYPEAVVLEDAIDWRTKAPQCTTISKVLDQSACGSCWAFAATETYEDRRCVATGEDAELSTQDAAGCCTGFACGASHGCKGGQPTAALNWMAKNGLVSGGDFSTVGKGASCKPYQLAPCAHHVPATPSMPACGAVDTIHCTTNCSETAYGTPYSQDKSSGGTARACNTIDTMLAALQKGPISATFTVMEDFPAYKSGVYSHTTAKALGGHAVEIVGYGTEGGKNYWLVKNSWNDKWGDNGFFKILRGKNECGIEQNAAAIDF
eukprot:g6676.t1